MTDADYVDKILERFRKTAERKQRFGEPHDPSPNCKVCHGTGWETSDLGKGRMHIKCACMWPKPN
jgi:hypothetical protein